MFKKIISLALALNLIISQLLFAQGIAELNIGQYLSQLRPAGVDKFSLPYLKYFTYDSLTDKFNLFLDKGDLKDSKNDELQDDARELLNYFLIGISLPNEKFWVNLRPDAEDQIVEQELEQTDLGRVLLEADLQLKKDTARFTSPQAPEGKEYWDKLYKRAGELFGSEDITIPTITRPWIVPAEIIVRESEDSAYIYKATLKVLLEEDYLKSSQLSAFSSQQYNFKDSRLKALNEYSTQLIRETIIPKLTKEVNSSKRYAKLRQVYSSLILSRWFKERFKGKEGAYAKRIDSYDLTGLSSKEAWNKTAYFNQYRESFNKGEYNISEPVYTTRGQVIRRYTSGGGLLTFGFKDTASTFKSDAPIEPERDKNIIVLNNINAGQLAIQNLAHQETPQRQKTAASAVTSITTEHIEQILNMIKKDTNTDVLLEATRLKDADIEVLKLVRDSMYSKVMEAEDGQSDLTAEEKDIVNKKYTLLDKVITRKIRHPYVSWKEFEDKELIGKGISQSSRNLSRPLKLAFNIDTFAADSNVALYGGANRIFDAIFRLLEGNPNFVPEAIFLGDYALGMPSNMERLAEFLKSNPVHGNAKYSVKLKGNVLHINGKAIKLYWNFADAKLLKKLGIDFLIEAQRQSYLDDTSAYSGKGKLELKRIQETEQENRINQYLDIYPHLKVVVIAPEEDKDFNGDTPVINMVNVQKVIMPEARKFTMAEPVTAVSGIMARVVSEAVKSQNESAKVAVVKVEAIRTDREGNSITNIADSKPGLMLNKVLENQESGFATQVSNNGVLSGANAIRLILRVDGFLNDFSAEAINEAFRTASKGVFKGMIEVKGEPTTSSLNTFNQHSLVYLPIKSEDIKTVNPPDRAPYKTVSLSGYYSETGYAKQVLDLMTGVSMFEGNKVRKNDFKQEEFPPEAIPATPELIRLQKVPDAEAIPVVINGGRGRIAINTFLRLWDDPNFEVVLLNGVREKVEDLVAAFFEYDSVFGQSPFEVELTANKKAFKFTDRQERVVWVSDSTKTSLGEGKDIIRTPYGNLLVEQKNGLIIMKLHGEDVERMSIKDNQDNTFTMQGSLRNGTIVRLTYGRGESEDTVKLISAGVKKQRIVKIANIRADEDVYAYDKKKEKDAAAFSNKVREYNKKLARRIIAELPELNENTVFLDCSGAMLEQIKFEPFYMAGSGRGIISAPSKAAKDQIPGATLVDATVIPGVNSDAFISAWDILETVSCASCTSNAAALGAKALMDVILIASGYFDSLHAITKTQGGQFGDLLKNITRSVDARGNIVFESTGASTELGKAIPEFLNIISGVSLRNGTDDGSLVTFDFQVSPGAEGTIPSAEEINTKVKWLSQTPEIEGGLKGFLGYGSHKTSLEIIGSEFGGIFDPSRTVVNKDGRTVSVSIWYDNERGYTNQYVMLALLNGLHQREQERNVDVIAQDVMVSAGAYTGGISIDSAVKSGAKGAIIGSRQCRIFEEGANRTRKVPVNINELMNQKIKQALAVGMELPILNIYISQKDLQRSEAAVAINRQLAESLKDIPSEDIVRIMFSLEVDEAGGFGMNDYESFAKDIRKAVGGLVEMAFLAQSENEKAEIEEKFGTEGYKKYISGLKSVARGDKDKDVLANYARVLGANVASKVRVILKFGSVLDSAENIANIVSLSIREGIDGIIMPSLPFETAGEIIKDINETIENNPVKKQELSKRFLPRFFLSMNLGSHFVDKKSIEVLLNSEINSHSIQLASMPNLADIGDVSAVLRGEDLPPNRATFPDKVPVRIMLQDGTSESSKEGFVNIEEAVKRLGVHDVLISHSEVLERTGMSDEEVAKLVVYAQGLKDDGILRGDIIAAVGENFADYVSGSSKKIVGAQVKNRLDGLTPEQVGNMVIAYEPRWAIGAGKPATEQEIQDTHFTIRSTIEELYGFEAARKVRIIYGGSFNLENAEKILRLKDVDGALIGGASVDPEVFKKIVELVRKIAEEKNASRDFLRKMFIAGNHKAYKIKGTYDAFVNMIDEGDNGMVEVSIGPELNNIAKLAEVYTRDPLKDIVALDQLSPHEYKGKVFYVRFAGNVPINDAKAQQNNPDTWEITDNTRLLALKDTVDLIRRNGGIVVLHTHFEPKGNNLNGPQSIRFLIPHLKDILGVKDIPFVSGVLGSGKQNALRLAKGGDVILLENLRLDKEVANMEKAEGNTPEAIAARNKLASLLYTGTNSANPKANVVYVNDSFDTVHRENSSIVAETPGIARVAGLSFVKELTYGIKAIREARHPVAIVFGGGAKIGDKIPMLKNIIKKTLTTGDKLFVYGGAAIPFLMAKKPGFETGLSRSLVNQENLSQAKGIIQLAQQEGVEVILPVDFVVADSLPSDESQRVFTQTVGVDEMSPLKGAYDIGPRTVEQFKTEVLDYRGKSKFGVIIGNGPAGVYEFEQFIDGSRGIYGIIAQATKNEQNFDGAQTILGGGDTATVARLTGLYSRFSFISTGGGAFLNLLEGKDLPGVIALRGKSGVYSYHLRPDIEKGYENIREPLSDYAVNNVPYRIQEEDGIVVQEETSSSSLTRTEKPEDVGGIDFRAMNMLIQPQGAFLGLDLTLPVLSSSAIEAMNLDEELADIQRMINSEIVPSGQRLKEFLAACFEKGAIEEKASSVVLCIEDIFKLQQQEAQESASSYKEVLVIADTRRYVKEEGHLASGRYSYSLN